MDRIELSVIVVNFNTSALLRCCLKTIAREASHLPLEIIVVDNASHDGSADMVAREFPRVKLLRNDQNHGFARANNQGLQVATGAFLLLLNSDTQVRAGAFRRCLDFFYDYPEAGIVGCKLLNADGTVQPSCESFLSLSNFLIENLFLEKVFPRSPILGRPHLSYFNYDRVMPVDSVKGAFLMIRRSTMENIGMLDESFFFYAEEMDWCYRAKQKGWQVYFTPEAEVIHYGGKSGDPLSPNMFVQLHRARYQFYRKHHNAFFSFVARCIMACGAVLRVAGWLLILTFRSVFVRGQVPVARKRLTAFFVAAVWFLSFKKP